MKRVFISILMLSSFAIADVDISGGRYYVVIDGRPIDQYFLQYHTAVSEAINQSTACKCRVVVTQPDIEVFASDNDLDVLISWEQMTDAEQYQLTIGDRLLEFDSDVLTFRTMVHNKDNIRVRYTNGSGVYGEWSDPAVVEF